MGRFTLPLDEQEQKRQVSIHFLFMCTVWLFYFWQATKQCRDKWHFYWAFYTRGLLYFIYKSATFNNCNWSHVEELYVVHLFLLLFFLYFIFRKNIYIKRNFTKKNSTITQPSVNTCNAADPLALKLCLYIWKNLRKLPLLLSEAYEKTQEWRTSSSLFICCGPWIKISRIRYPCLFIQSFNKA